MYSLGNRVTKHSPTRGVQHGPQGCDDGAACVVAGSCLYHAVHSRRCGWCCAGEYGPVELIRSNWRDCPLAAI